MKRNWLNVKIDKAMLKSKEYYSLEDRRWIGKNIILVARFFDEADKHRNNGIKKSHRRIGRYLREETQAHDKSKNFKILNAGITLIAHIYNDCQDEPYFIVATRKPFEAAA